MHFSINKGGEENDFISASVFTGSMTLICKPSPLVLIAVFVLHHAESRPFIVQETALVCVSICIGFFTLSITFPLSEKPNVSLVFIVDKSTLSMHKVI